MKIEICRTCQWYYGDYGCGQYRWSEVPGENDGMGNAKPIYSIKNCEYVPFEERLEENEEFIKNLARKYNVDIYDGFLPHVPIFKIRGG